MRKKTNVSSSRLSGWKALDLTSLLLLVVAGCGLTLWVFLMVRNWEYEKIEDRFHEQAKERIAPFLKELDHNILEVDALKRLYASSRNVDRQEFTTFVTTALERHPDIKAFEWIPRVSAAERPAHEQAVRQEGIPDYRITEKAPDGSIIPAGNRDVYYPVTYIAPLSGNEEALGFAPGPAHSERWAAIETALESGCLTASGRMRLVQEPGGPYSVLIFAPVYGQDNHMASPADRRQKIRGLVLGILRVGPTFEQSIEGLRPAGIDVRILDQSAPADKRLLYEHQSRLRWENTPYSFLPGPLTRPHDGLQHVQEIKIGGRLWSLICTPTDAFYGANYHWESWSLLTIGLLFTCWITSLFIGNRRTTVRIAAEVAQRTCELQKSEARFRSIFETIQDVYSETRLDDGVIIELSPSVESLLGYPCQELLGQTFARLYAQPSGRSEFLARLKEDGFVHDYEVPLLHREGRRIICSFNARLTTDDSGMKKIVGTIRDVTARKRSEEILREMIEEAEQARSRAEVSEETLRQNEHQLLEILAEMERFNQLMLRREGRVLELKQEVNELCAELGRAPAYHTAGGGS